MWSKGMLMVVSGFGGIILTIIGGLLFYITSSRKKSIPEVVSPYVPKQVIYKENSNSNSGLVQIKPIGTELIRTEPIADTGGTIEYTQESGTGTDVLVSAQVRTGTDILEPQGTELIINRTTVISD